ncbi:MAG: hypothetical protein IAE95_09900 [Chitinophagaceae bacterium]|nr:hypothetical protein [Chitinophagaceae bacterium]
MPLPKELEYVLAASKLVEQHYYRPVGIGNNQNEINHAGEGHYTLGLVLQLETLKPEYGDNERLIWQYDIPKVRANDIQPDLVFHDPADGRPDQRIYIEIKTDPGTTDARYNSDLEKLIRAVSPNDTNGPLLGFSFGIFLVGNKQLNQLETLIRNMRTNIGGLAEKLYLIYFDRAAYDPKIKCFTDILI